MASQHKPCDRYRGATYVAAAHLREQFPADFGGEVAFVGRSNAGKSSVINTVTGHKGLAHTSKTPGRTQQIVFFKVNELIRLVDLPGYGHASVKKDLRDHWEQLMDGYFAERQSLKGLVIIMDIRHPLKDTDWQMLEWSKKAQLPVRILLNKADKLSNNEIAKTNQQVKKQLSEQGMSHAEFQTFSTLKPTGHQELCNKISEWLGFEVETKPK